MKKTSAYFFRDLRQLVTHDGNVVFLDIASGQLRHGPALSSPCNAFLSGSDEQGQLVYAPDVGGHLEIRLAPGLAPAPTQLCDPRSESPQIWTLVPAEGGGVGLWNSGLHLCAQPDGSATLSRSQLGAWERFFVIDEVVQALTLVPETSADDGLAIPPSATLQPPSRPERTLVCILAQTRAHALTWANFKRNVLDELHADLALAIGVDDHYDYANPFWQHAQYRWVAPEYADFGIGFDEAQRWLAAEAGVPARPWRRLLETGGNWLGGVNGRPRHAGAGGLLIYFRWFLRHQITQNGLLDRYDRFVITRSDFVWTTPHPPLSVLTPEAIWFPHGEFCGGLTDRHLTVSRSDLLDVLGLLDDIVLRPEELFARLGQSPEHNLERYIYFHLRTKGFLGRTRLFPYVMYAVRGEGDPTSWAVGVWNDKVGARLKYPDEYKAASPWQGRLKSRADWERLQQEHPDLFPKMW